MPTGKTRYRAQTRSPSLTSQTALSSQTALTSQTAPGGLALSVDQLSIRFGSRPALLDVDFELVSGSTLAVIGPNGSGKSTLLHAIAGLAPISAGSIDRHQRSTAIVLQATNVDAGLPITVEEAVGIARYESLGMFRRFAKMDHAAVQDAMARTRVNDLAQRQLNGLSGGQRQRVFLAQGLAQQADILLLDEPSTGLDIMTKRVILDVVSQERDAGRTVIMTTHSIDEAMSCDRVLLMATAAIAFGTPTDVIQAKNLSHAFGDQILGLISDPTVKDVAVNEHQER